MDNLKILKHGDVFSEKMPNVFVGISEHGSIESLLTIDCILQTKNYRENQEMKRKFEEASYFPTRLKLPGICLS